MKKLLLLVIALSMILSPLGIKAEESHEIVFTDSFEHNILANWNFTTLSTKTSVMQTEGIYTDGTISVYISDIFTDKTSGLVSKPFDITAGETYTAAIDMYVVSGISIRGFLKFFSADGKSLLAKSFSTKETEKWTTISLTAVAPENATKATLTICGTGKEEGGKRNRRFI